MITGVTKGSQGTFTETPVPVGGALQAGDIPSWSSDDATVGLQPSADGTSVIASVPADSTATSFNLTVNGINSQGTKIQTTVSVPILAPAPPPATGFQIDQIA